MIFACGLQLISRGGQLDALSFLLKRNAPGVSDGTHATEWQTFWSEGFSRAISSYPISLPRKESAFFIGDNELRGTMGNAVSLTTPCRHDTEFNVWIAQRVTIPTESCFGPWCLFVQVDEHETCWKNHQTIQGTNICNNDKSPGLVTCARLRRHEATSMSKTTG